MLNSSEVNSHDLLVDYIQAQRLGRVDARQWHTEWDDRWVVFADLIAFASRAKRSSDVVLNNIVRFDRASNIASSSNPNVRTYRFSDSTFAIAESFIEAMGFAIALHHSSLAMNADLLRNNEKKLFIYMIVPRITVARGQVLRLPKERTISTDMRFIGLNPEVILAGDGVVRAYELEKKSAGGLLTIHRSSVPELLALRISGAGDGTHKSLVACIRRIGQTPSPAGTLFVRGELVDFPWLLLKPFRVKSGNLICAKKDEMRSAISDFLNVLELSAREYYSPQAIDSPLGPEKHYQAALRHAVHCAQASSGHPRTKYFTFEQARELLVARTRRRSSARSKE